MPQNQINAGQKCHRLGGEITLASQCIQAIGRILLFDTDASEDTLRSVLEIETRLDTLLQRITDRQPTITRAQQRKA
jgi:hypothetical protein